MTDVPEPRWLPLLRALEAEQPGRHVFTLSLLLEVAGGPKVNALVLKPWLEKVRSVDGDHL